MVTERNHDPVKIKNNPEMATNVRLTANTIELRKATNHRLWAAAKI